jgi:hypothetical protein
MRWTMLIVNVLAAGAFVFVGATLTRFHRAHAYSMYRELEYNRALVEKPTYTDGKPLDVEARLRAIGGGGQYYSFLGYLGAGACLLNGFVFFVSHHSKTATASPQC